MKMKIEVWKSNDTQEECHLFIENERNTYLIGYNPTYFTPEDIENLLYRKGYIP